MMNTDLIWNWFGLSYSSHLVLPRALLCDLPGELQEKFMEVLNYIEDNYRTEDMPSDYMVRAKRDGKFISDPFTQYRHFDMGPWRREKQDE